MRRIGLWDHPRVCGEKETLKGVWLALWGSPPRMRGKAFRVGRGIDFVGITPAYAGKSITLFNPAVIIRDHPRVCGEKTKKIP